VSANGKGSKRRPSSVDQKTFETNWNKIFKKEKNGKLNKSKNK